MHEKLKRCNRLGEGGRGIASIAQLTTLYNNLSWKKKPGPDGKGGLAFAVLDGHRSSGGVWVAAAIEKTHAPKHEHLADPENSNQAYGEMIITVAGLLVDQDIIHEPGCVFFHPPNSIHQPYAPKFWWGFYHQPHGSRAL